LHKAGGALFLVNPLGFTAREEAAQKVTVSSTQVRSSGAQLDEAGRLLEAGLIRVVIDSTYPLAMASAAHQRAAMGDSGQNCTDELLIMAPVYDASADTRCVDVDITELCDRGMTL
jgi:NADPH:quinone reductase-like Zn-dependent oxidoreductase